MHILPKGRGYRAPYAFLGLQTGPRLYWD